MFPARFLELARTAEFWSDYFLEEVFGEGVADLPGDGNVLFPFGSGRQLRLRYAAKWAESEPGRTSAGAIHLLSGRDGNGELLAWYDSHAHQHLLRWEEADLIGRHIALAGGAVTHPSFPLLLLSAFVAPVAGTDCRLGRALMSSALSGSGVFEERQVACRTPASSPILATCEWRHAEPFGWHVQHLGVNFWENGSRPIHSTRFPPTASGRNAFPFREWNEGLAWLVEECRARTGGHPLLQSTTAQALVRAAVDGPDLVAAGALADWLDENDFPHAVIPACLRSEEPVRVGWALESLGDLPAGEVIGRLVPSNPSSELEELELRLQFPHYENAYGMLRPLVAALYEEGIGTCSLSGSWSAFETVEQFDRDMNDPAVNAGDEHIIRARAELNRVVETVRRTAAANGNPPVRLYQRLPGLQDPPYRRLL